MAVPTPQQAFGFLQSQMNYIEREVYKIRYPEIQYPLVVPISTEADEWARGITWYSSDVKGQAKLIAAAGQDIPRVQLDRAKHDVVIEMAGMGFEYNLDELMTAMRQDINLTADKGAGARRVAEELLDDLVADGDTDRKWDGFLNNADIPRYDVENGAGGGKAWRGKTAEEIIRDFNGNITGIYTSTKTVEMADTVLLPDEIFMDIASMPYRDMTVLMFLRANNAYTAKTGQPLTILTYRGLETAGSGGTGRFIAYRRAADVLRFHMPMMFRFLPVFQESSMRWVVDGIMRVGGLEIRLPNAIRYGDGIMVAA